jgi:hypothetical protein
MRRLVVPLAVVAVGFPACERTATAAQTGDPSEPAGVLGASDAAVIICVITVIVAPIVTAAVASWRSRKRAALLAAEMAAVRTENTEQHNAGQDILRTLVDSHHLVVGKVDGLAGKVDDFGSKLGEVAGDVAELKQSAHHHPQPEGAP